MGLPLSYQGVHPSDETLHPAPLTPVSSWILSCCPVFHVCFITSPGLLLPVKKTSLLPLPSSLAPISVCLDQLSSNLAGTLL